MGDSFRVIATVQIFGFGPEVGRHINQYGSDFVISRLARPEGLHVACMHLPPRGSVGLHQAATYQLFIVVQGAGWVQGDDEQQAPIKEGQAAFWQPGEQHGAGSEQGMVALVVEGDILGGNPDDIGPIPRKPTES